ncbi:MAG: carbohydrate kinase [Oscillospiraceae bacterium]|nr:carbohydrate kinase [Oscillospiraceae bacterium]
MKEFYVAALGELLIDFTADGTLSSQGNRLFEANPGGAPCNVLAMLQKLGRHTAFIGKVGNDTFGKMLKNTVQNAGINTDNLLTDDSVPTTLAFVHNAPDGDRSFSFYRNPGADMMLRSEEIDLNLIKNSRIFHFGTLSMTDSGIESATKTAIDAAKQSGAIISFDPNLRPPLWKNLDTAKEKIQYGLSLCDVLKISDDEIAFLTGTDDVDKGIDLIRKEYDILLICATMGRKGSKAYYKDIAVSHEAFLDVNAIETTGAGDTFMACVLDAVLKNDLYGFSEQKLYDMMTFANAASAIITTRRGALKVMPQKEEVLNFLSEHT